MPNVCAICVAADNYAAGAGGGGMFVWTSGPLIFLRRPLAAFTIGHGDTAGTYTSCIWNIIIEAFFMINGPPVLC